MQLDSATKTATEMRANLETERKTYSARIEELEKMGAEIERNFAVLASEALGKNSENFLKLMSERFEKHKAAAEKDLEDRQKAIESLVKPVSESLSKFEHEVGELEMAGMTEHVDFIEERTIEGDGGRLRPDVIVRLPGGKSVVIDAKTPLEAYLAALDTNDEETRERQMVDHARQVRDHVRTLASREYWKALPVTPDFVVMFVPGEAFFAAAIESDPSLFEQAVRQHVLISTPTTLVALVKAIAYGWQQEKLAENAQAVASLARDLFDRIKIFGGYMRE